MACGRLNRRYLRSVRATRHAVSVTDDELRQRLERLEEQVHSLIVAVRYRREEPWLRECLGLGIHGQERRT